MFCVDIIYRLHCQESIFNTFWLIDDGIMMYFRWSSLDGSFYTWIEHVYCTQFFFLWVPRPSTDSENWFLSQCSRNHSILSYNSTIHHLLDVLCSVWMALPDSPPRSHQHKCVLSHWWQGDYIVLGGQRQCLFPQIQSKVHTGKEEREKAAEI